MDKEITNIITKIHKNDSLKGSLVVTGCGSTAISWLLSIPGASKTILSAYVPYSKLSLEKYLNKELKNHVSEEESINMANKAYLDSSAILDINQNGIKIFGLSCTGAISTDRERKGEDKAHISLRSENKITTYSIHFDKNNRNRITEEIIISKIIINSIASLYDINERITLGLFKNEKFYTSHRIIK
jgi:nicotinamide mononucleotide (NMN) deamidase PncC